MERGSLVAAVFSRELGRPRPALVIQSDDFQLGMVALLPITSYLQPGLSFRIDVLPTSGNGLKRRSQVMVDRSQSVAITRIGKTIGRLDVETQHRVDLMLSLFLGLA